MFKINFIIAYRNLWRARQSTLINIGGLALGITVFIFIMEYVGFEWSANRFNKNYKEIYRVNVQDKKGNTEYLLPPGYAPILRQQFPAVDNYVRLADGIATGAISAIENNNLSGTVFRVNNMAYADGNLFTVFSFPMVAGSASLSEPKTVALSEKLSRKIFGTTDVIGKTVFVSNQFGKTLYTIKAIYQLPEESDIKSDVILSIQTLESAVNRNGNDWADPSGLQSGFTSIYLKVKKGTNTVLLADNITKYIQSANPDSKDDRVLLQGLSDLHLAPAFDYPLQTYGNLLLVTVFTCIAILILFLGWMNYINLSTAQALTRTKEIGVRKVLGASKRQLTFQYLTETLILTFTSTCIALMLVNIFQNSFNGFAGKQYSMTIFNHGWIWLSGLLLIVTGSLLSGSYVAFVLTSFKPIATISRKENFSVKGMSLRKGLVVFQFAGSITLIIATVIIYKQLKYMQKENLGMNLKQLLVIQGPTFPSEGQAAKNVSFKNALSQLPFISKYTGSNNVPGVGYNFLANGITNFANPTKEDSQKSFAMFICDDRYFDTYGIRLSQGKVFSQQDAQGSWNNIKKVIINEKAAATLGFNKNDVVGKKIMWGAPYEIIGVVNDYHHLSLREEIKPTVYLASESFGYFTVQTDSRNIQDKINTIKNLYNSNFPGNPFEYFFADEKYDQQYLAEQKIGNVFIAAALFAIFIACLGLFGLASFSARQRIKEIGIRKVLGATVGDITTLLSKDFIHLVTIGMIIAFPISWWSMNKWLQGFAFRTEINWWVFVLSGLLAMLIAFLTISSQTFKAGLANPIKSLRSE